MSSKKKGGSKSKELAKVKLPGKAENIHGTKTTVLNAKLIKVKPANDASDSQTDDNEVKTDVETGPELTEEEKKRVKAAVCIQKWWKRYSAQLLVKRMRKERAELDEKMKKLEEDAFIQVFNTLLIN